MKDLEFLKKVEQDVWLVFTNDGKIIDISRVVVSGNGFLYTKDYMISKASGLVFIAKYGIPTPSVSVRLATNQEIEEKKFGLIVSERLSFIKQQVDNNMYSLTTVKRINEFLSEYDPR